MIQYQEESNILQSRLLGCLEFHYSEAGCLSSLGGYLSIVDNTDRIQYQSQDYSPFQKEIRLHKMHNYHILH